MKFLISLFLTLSLSAHALTGKILQGDAVSGTDAKTNYITNGDAEYELRGVAAYNDSSGNTPIDCTGGTPTITVAASDSNPIAPGKKSWLISKPASNAVGQGVAFTFKVDSFVSSVKMLDLLFKYSFASGFWTTGDTGDIRVFLYDIDEGKLVNLQGGNGLYDGDTGSAQRKFQSTLGSLNYRLCFHQGTSNANAYTFKVDDIIARLQEPSVIAPLVTDRIDYTPTISAYSGALTNYTLYGTQYSIVGDNIFLFGTLTFNGAVGTWSNPQISLPTGFTAVNDHGTLNGGIGLIDVSNNTYRAEARINNGIVQIISGRGTNGAGIAVSNTSPFTWTNPDRIEWILGPIKLDGFKGGVRLADSYVGREVSFIGGDTGSNQSLTGVTTNYQFTSVKDTVGCWNGSSCTIKSAGDYEAILSTNSTAISDFAIYINGTVFKTVAVVNATNTRGIGSLEVPNLKVGDVVTVRAITTTTVISSNNNSFSFRKINNTSAYFKPTAKLHVVAKGTTGTNITSGGNAVIFNTVSENTMGWYNSTNGEFTPQNNMFCDFSWRHGTNTVVNSTTQQVETRLMEDSSVLVEGDKKWGAGVSRDEALSGSIVGVPVSPGKRYWVRSSSSNTVALGTGTGSNWLNIVCR